MGDPSGDPSGAADPPSEPSDRAQSPTPAAPSAPVAREGSSARVRWLALVLGALWLWPLAIPLVDRADSAGYVSVTASLAEEGDVVLVDEYAALEVWDRYARISPTGLAAHHWSPGVGMAMVPAYAATRSIAPDRPLPSKVAYAALQATGLAWALLLGLLLWRLTAGVPMRVRAVLVAASFFATPLAYYTHAQAIRPHLLEALGVAAFLVTLRDVPPSRARSLGLGWIAAGLVLVRPQMAAVALVAVPGLVSRVRASWAEGSASGRRAARRALAADAAAWLAPVALAVAIGRGWSALLYGDDAGSLLDALVHAQYHPWDVMVSAHHGLLTWSPVFALAAWGSWLALRDRDPLAVGILVFVAVQWLLNGSSYEQAVDAYHHTRHVEGGFSYGARRFVGLAPVVAWSLAAAWTRLHPGRPRQVFAAALGLAAVHGLVLTLDARVHPDLLLTPGSYGALARWPIDALARLPETLAWWWARRPDAATAFVAWWVGAAQLTVIAALAFGWRRLPAGRRPALAVGVSLALGASCILIASTVAGRTRRHAQDQAAELEALARRSRHTRDAVQRGILLEQARLRSARGDVAGARSRYEAALAIRGGADVQAELDALPAP